MGKKNIKLKKGKKYTIPRIIFLTLFIVVIICGVSVVSKLLFFTSPVERLAELEIPEWITQDIISPGGPSRRETPLKDFNDIVIHYVGNKGTTAKQNRDYFDDDKSEVSSHFVVGLEGEIIQCLPLNEQSAASNHRNADTVSIEVCHPDDTGAFNAVTYDALVRLTAWLCAETGLTADNVIRHYDVTGKECPRYYVQYPEAWDSFKNDVNYKISLYKAEKEKK